MLDDKIRERVSETKSLEEVKEILKGYSNIDAERVWKESERHRSSMSKKNWMSMNLTPLAVTVTAIGKKDGCAATCEEGSWCWSNDKCEIFDVVYSKFWECCPDGHPHEYDINYRCLRCGHVHKTAGSYDDN